MINDRAGYDRPENSHWQNPSFDNHNNQSNLPDARFDPQIMKKKAKKIQFPLLGKKFRQDARNELQVQGRFCTASDRGSERTLIFFAFWISGERKVWENQGKKSCDSMPNSATAWALKGL